MLGIENYFLWNSKRSQDEQPMCSRGYFYRGNEKQTRTNLKNINVVLLRMSHSLKATVYISYIVPSTEPRFFSGERRGKER